MTIPQPLFDILKLHSVDGAFFTHVGLINKGRYQFNRKDMDTFFDEYADNVLRTIETSKIGVAEKPQMYLPVLVDVDMKVKTEDLDINDDIPSSIYTLDQVRKVVKVYQDVLRNILVDYTDEELCCILLEKDAYKKVYKEVEYVKRGFHLHFPYIFLNKSDHEVNLLPRVKKSIKEQDVFCNLEIEDSSSVIDAGYCHTPWLLYGGRKSPEMFPYLVTKCFDSNCEEVSLYQCLKSYLIYDDREKIIPICKDVEKQLPRILSIIPFGRETKEVRKGLPTLLKARERKSVCRSKVSTDIKEDLIKCKIYLNLLSEETASNYQTWMDVGWTLYCVGNGCQDALDLWIDFSSRSNEKFDEGICVNEWDKMVVKNKTIRSIQRLAKLDNEVEYKKVKSKITDKRMRKSLDEGSHADIAELLKEEYGDKYVCASITGNIWYEFIGHRWEEVEEGYTLRKKISEDIRLKYTALLNEVFPLTNNPEKKDHNAEAAFKECKRMLKNLKNNTFKNNIMKEARDLFFDKDFFKKLNSDPYLIAMKNGVYDLKKNEFRKGTPDDFLSRCMPISYKVYPDDHEDLAEVNDYFTKVFPDSSLREYFLDQISDIFVGGNRHKLVHHWTGEGDNAKSVTQSIIEMMFGEYAIKFNSSILTGKKPGAGSANADLARAGDGIRFAVVDEPNNDEKINCGPYKKFSGNDTEFVRDLYQSGKQAKEVKFMFKLVIIANDLPHFNNPDKATFNRTRVVPFESTFCKDSDPAPETYEEQLKQKRFPVDPNYSSKIPKLLPAFAYFLLEHRKKPKSSIIPSKVLSATAMYKKQNDINRQFIEQCIVDEESARINISELYTQFKEWFKDSFPGRTLPNKNKVREYFTKLWGEPRSGKILWDGHRLRTMKDDIAEGNCVVLEEKDLATYNEKKSAAPV